MKIADILNPLLETTLPLLQTDTPEFKQWFGFSKVVDKQGNPLMMYHGTSKDKDFTSFKVGNRGVWFTMWNDEASNYSMNNDSKNSKYDPDTRKYVDVNTASRVIPVYLKIENPYTITNDDMKMVNVDNYARAQSILFSRIKSEGYDGIHWSPPEWVILGNSSQIKSAIGNKGSFNPSNKNIHESRFAQYYESW
jgi:hypothetical protein